MKTVFNMKNKELYKLLKKNKSNSGFTLTELLVGLFMSIFVIGALGFGLMQLLGNTKTEASKINARTETSRAFSFVADEVKAAQFMESVLTDSHLNTVAADYATKKPLGVNVDVRLVLQVPGVKQRIIYTVAPKPSGSVWKGPFVIYRWGPNLKADGAYSNPNDPGSWSNEPLIDNVSDENQTVTCGTNTIDYKGFYACVLDDDNDSKTENATDINGDGKIDKNDTGVTDKNGDGIINDDDGGDVDKRSITAQVYFASKTEKGVYKTNSQVVARARVAPLLKEALVEPEPVNFTSLKYNFGDSNCWNVRNDFGAGENPNFDPDHVNVTQSSKALKNVMTWVHENNRQPQPLNIDTTKPFTMVASAFAGSTPDGSNCNPQTRGNKYKQKLVSINDNGTSPVYENVDANGNTVNQDVNRVLTEGNEPIFKYKEKVWHTIEFPTATDSTTEKNRKLATFNGGATDNADVKGDGTVYVFSKDSIIPNTGGYDADNAGATDQPSIREFLRDPNGDKDFSDAYVNSDGTVIAGKLKDNQRIVAFEIGQTNKFLSDGTTPNPGFDSQDTIFIMTSNAFKSSTSN